MMDRLEQVRQKPEHIRKQLAFIAAAVLTGLIAVFWFGANLASGAYALRGPAFGGAFDVATPDSSQLASPAAATTQTDTQTPSVHVVDSGRSAPKIENVKKAEPTIIPF